MVAASWPPPGVATKAVYGTLWFWFWRLIFPQRILETTACDVNTEEKLADGFSFALSIWISITTNLRPHSSAGLRLRCTHGAQLQAWPGRAPFWSPGEGASSCLLQHPQPSPCPGPAPSNFSASNCHSCECRAVSFTNRLSGHVSRVQELQSRLPVSRSAVSQILTLSCRAASTHGPGLDLDLRG